MLWDCEKHPHITHDEHTLPGDGKCHEVVPQHCVVCGGTNLQFYPSTSLGQAICSDCEKVVDCSNECGLPLGEIQHVG